jgi:translation initiation factor IF-1
MRAMSENSDKIELEGEVIEALRGRMFRIQLDSGHLG